MAFKVEQLVNGVLITDTNTGDVIEFLNPNNNEVTINNLNIGIYVPKINKHIILGEYGNIRKGDDSTPISFNDAISYLSEFVY